MIAQSVCRWRRGRVTFTASNGNMTRPLRGILFSVWILWIVSTNVFLVFLYSCNTTAIEDMELGALTEFVGLQKKVERGEWLTSTPVWLYSPAQKEEGRRKYDEHGMRARPSGGGGGRDTVFNHGVNLQLRFLERLGDMMTVARSENLRIPLAEDGG